MDLPVIYPMKAKSDDKRLEFWWHGDNVVAEEKYDGSRYLMYITPEGSRFFSRRKSDVTGFPVEKTENLPHLNKHKAEDLIILDGEIIAGEYQTSNEVTSIIGSLPERAINLQKERGYVNYIVFDILNYFGRSCIEERWKNRRKLLESVVPVIGDEYIHSSPYVVKNKWEFYEEIVKKGGEGVILKDINAKYFPGKSPVGNWIKVKKYETYDVIITGYEPPEKYYTGKYPEDWAYWECNHSGEIFFNKNEAIKQGRKVSPVTRFHANGWIGAIKFGAYVNGEFREIGRTSGMDDSIRAEISKNPTDFIGQIIEVGCMGVIPKTKALRHPRFLRVRNDKNKEECII